MSWLDEETSSWLDAAPPEKREELPAAPLSVAASGIPADAAERNAAVEKAWQSLRGMQQRYLESLRNHGFDQAATLRALKKTNDAPNRATVHRWRNEDADFAFILKVMKAIARDEVIDPDRLLLRADQIAETAMEGHEIFDKDGKIIGHRQQLDVALRANEQLMKTQKMLGNDDTPRGFAEGPAFVIQVVQPDGGLVNVIPRGVELPALPGPEDGA